MSSAFQTSEVLDLTDGTGSITGVSTLSEDALSIPTDYITNKSVEFYLNGVKLEKGIQVVYSSDTLQFNISLDPLDRIRVMSEENS